MSEPNLNVPVAVSVVTATKAFNASYVLGVAWVALLAKSVADGNLSWAEGYELIGALLAAGGSIFAVWKSRNKPK